MKRTLCCFLYLCALYLAPRDVYGQVTAGKRDSLVADSLQRLRPYNNGWRLTSLNRQINALRTPHPPSAGVETVTVTIRDTVRITRVDTVFVPRDTVIATNRAPVASFTRSCASATRLCSVNASGSTDDVGITSYQWSWGDGATSTGVSPSHTDRKSVV